MEIVETQTGFNITFPFDRTIVEEIKKIPGHRWLPHPHKIWWVPKFQSRSVDQLRERFCRNLFPIPELPELTKEIPLKRALFPFQTKGVAYCLEKHRVIIGDQPGLGKTSQLIATLMGLNAFPALIICPATLKLNWQKEWMEVTGKPALILSDRIKDKWYQYYKAGQADIFICNYESIKKYFVDPGWKKPEGQYLAKDIPLKGTASIFKSLTVDESHKIKEPSTQHTKFVIRLSKNCDYRFLLTGTPVVNQPNDLISQLVVLGRLPHIVSHIPVADGRDLSGYQRFKERYCGKGGFNLKELNHRLNMFCFYRREKSEVLKDLPSKIRQTILCDITNRNEYAHAENEFIHYLRQVKNCNDEQLKKKMKALFMVKLGVLKQISARGKIESVREYIEEITSAGEKVIIFHTLREIGDQLQEIFPDALMIRGGMTDEAKNHSVNSFQKDPGKKIILCSIKAAGVGITLTAASRVGFLEFPWTFADCEQCEDRAHRIGQDDSVQCSYFLGEDTIDRYCYEIIQKKKSISQTITGASDDIEEEVIDKMLSLFNQK